MKVTDILFVLTKYIPFVGRPLTLWYTKRACSQMEKSMARFFEYATVRQIQEQAAWFRDVGTRYRMPAYVDLANDMDRKAEAVILNRVFH